MVSSLDQDESLSLVDIGANLTHPSFKDDLEQVIARSKQAGMVKLLITGTSEKTSEEASAMASKDPKFLYFTAGVHPHDAKDCHPDTINKLEKLCSDPQCVAVGECGLDFNRNFSPPDVQKIVFEKQVELADRLGKPLFVHERDAHDEMVTILSRHKEVLPRTVIHCFTGTFIQAESYVSMGCFIGLTGFFWKDKTENGVKFALTERKIPLDKLMLETDAPFNYAKINDKKIPFTIRERISEKARDLHKFSSFKRNEPSSLLTTCELVAAYMNIDPKTVAAKTTANAIRFFRLA